jgi:adenylosuccinate lyase
VNNIAYSLQVIDALRHLNLAQQRLVSFLEDGTVGYAFTRMLGRTHGQPAIATTYGKELRVFANRLTRVLDGDIRNHGLTGKLNGATGTFAAHYLVRPDVDWRTFSREFVESFGLEHNLVTTQIEPHDQVCRLFDAIARFNTILLDLAQDEWLYIAQFLVKLRGKKGEVGSSTMAHKINPIQFENGMGNLKLSNTILRFFSAELPVSRMQRDLCDSTTQRYIGFALGLSLLAYKKILDGLGRTEPYEQSMLEDLQANPAVLSEAIQTTLRAAGVPNGYELVKDLTRDREVTLEIIAEFVDGLPLDDEVKLMLKELRPETYLGIAAQLAV